MPFGDLAAIERAITPDTAAVLIEPIQGEAGIIVPPAGYLAGLRRLCDAHNVLLILDEVQSGLGRTGAWFAFEHEGIRPDGADPGQGAGRRRAAGLRLCRHAARSWTCSRPARMARPSAAIRSPPRWALRRCTSSTRKSWWSAAAISAPTCSRACVRSPVPALKHVRGRGLWAGAEIDPAFATAREACERLLAKGVLSKETHRTVVRLAPPLVIARDDLDWALDRFEDVLRELDRRQPPRGAALAPGLKEHDNDHDQAQRRAS